MKNALRSLITLIFVSFGMLSFASVYAAAQNDTKQQAKVPQTAQDHYALADKYKREAAELQGEIEQHREMLAEYNLQKTAGVPIWFVSTKGFTPARCAAKCAVRFNPLCAKVRFFDTCAECFRAGMVEGK